MYGFENLNNYLKSLGYSFKSDSDCEILLPLYEKLGTAMFRFLDAEFACVIYDSEKKKLIAARDPIGIRPLFYGYDSEGSIMFASEAKNLVGLTDEVKPFPPGHYYKAGQFICYRDLSKRKPYSKDGVEETAPKIKELLVKGVEKRLDADAPVGFLLSGGLDSSVVALLLHKAIGKNLVCVFVDHGLLRKNEGDYVENLFRLFYLELLLLILLVEIEE